MSQEVQIVKQWMPTAREEFMAIAKPREYSDLITCQSPKFLPFMDRYGRPALEELFGRVILDVADGLGVTISGNMVADAVDLIVDEFPDTKLSDILLFKRDVLKGSVGGQVDDKLWKWNTRAIVQAWSEYYARREDAFAEHREARYNEDKKAYADGFAKAYRNASPDIQKQIQESTARFEAQQSAKRKTWEDKPFDSKRSLEEIAQDHGIDLTVLAETIRRKALENVDTGIPEVALIAAEYGRVQFLARKDDSILKDYIQ